MPEFYPKFTTPVFTFTKVPSPVSPIEKMKLSNYVPEVLDFKVSREGSATEHDVTSMYDPEEEYEDSMDEDITFEPRVIYEQNESINLKKSEEVVDNLSRALNEFQRLYYTHGSNQVEDDLAAESEVVSLEKVNRKLRKVVKRRLKRKNALKFARLWKKKVEKQKRKRENFVGIMHLSPEEYFRLWGFVKSNKPSTNQSVIEEVKDTQNAMQWGLKLLNSESLTVKYLGTKLAESLVQNVRVHCMKFRKKVGTIICWKMLLSLPQSSNYNLPSFRLKVSEFCRTLFYNNKENELGSVQVTQSNSIHVCTSFNIKIGVVDDDSFITGLTSCLIFIQENWNNLHEFKERSFSIFSSVYPIFVYVVIIGKCVFKSDVESFMNGLLKKRMIIGWKIIKWRNFLTIPKVVFEACKYIPDIPLFQVKNLPSFMEHFGSEFFLNLFYMSNKGDVENTPVVYIKLYNEFVTNLEKILNDENMEKYNLSSEFLSHIVGEERSYNNFKQKESVSSILTMYKLVSFTKWPPNSIRKLNKLLTEYCSYLDSGNTLLPNVLRLINAPWKSKTISEGCTEASWLKIVELWFRYNCYSLSGNEDVRKVFLFYDDSRIKNIVESLWLQKRIRIENDVSFHTSF